MQQYGAHSERQTQTRHRRQRVFLGSHVTRSWSPTSRSAGRWWREGANTLPSTTRTDRFHGDVFDTATVRAAMDGVDDVYYCVDRHPRLLRDTAPLFRTNVEGCATFSMSRQRARPAPFISPGTYATVGRRMATSRPEDDVIASRADALRSSECRPKTW